MKTVFNIDGTLYDDPIARMQRDLAIQSILGSSIRKYREYRKRFSELQALVMLGIERKDYYDMLATLKLSLQPDQRLRMVLLNLPFKKVIITGNPKGHAQHILESLGIMDLFHAVYPEEDKPSKDAFGIIEPRDICIGSTFDKDLAIPKKMGAVTVMIGDDSRAHHNLKSIYELDRLSASLRPTSLW